MDEKVDLNRLADEMCAREPIHLSGAIQPHGWLISCVLPDWTVRHASGNIVSLLDVPAETLVGQSLRDHLVEDLLQAVSDTIGLSDPGAPPQRVAVGNIGPLATLCDVSAHVAEGMIHLEIEPQPAQVRERTPTVVAQSMIARVANATDMEDFHQRAADQVRLLTGYDRVMVYRFRHDDSGEVIAEARAEDQESYLGLRYPASDIPAQARRLYLHSRLRVIPDANYAPVPVLPGRDASGQRLDLSQHALRSVSPVHLEYLRNMGVAASMSISIISGGRLWGLIACHHRVPRMVPPGIRAAADLFGLFVSMRISARDQEHAAAQDEHAREARDALGLRLAAASDHEAALADHIGLLRDTVPSEGLALRLRGRWHADGRVPERAYASLVDWLRSADGTRLAMSHRADDWRGGQDTAGLAGALGIPLGGGDAIFFFRAEQLEDVHWAGDPAKAQISDDGTRIAPRKSFATWSETVRGSSLPWSDADRRAAERLRLLLREQRRRLLDGDEGGVADLDAFRRQHVLREQKSRLDRLSALLDGLVHLEDGQAERLGERIARLEADLLELMRSQGAEDRAEAVQPAV